MVDEWLSLRGAADMLGVHPSTVRSWADLGQLPAHRTQGGRRRFLRSEVELWQQSRQRDGVLDPHLVVQTMLRRTRIEIGEGHLAAAAWYGKLDADARAQYAHSGRALL
jgi:excisionase family DNA binding protein